MLRLEKRLKRFLWLLPVFCLSCSEADFRDSAGAPDNGMARLTLDINAPAITNSVMTRAISSDNESSLNGDFAVFAFNSSDVLMWTLRTGAVNGTATNLQGDDGYDDNTTTPSLTWHAADDGSTGGRLYLEAPEYVGDVTLLVLANVDLSAVSAFELTAGSSTKDQVVAAFSALDYDATDERLDYIPMAAETELDGIMLGTTGTVQLRRSLAKFSLTFLWDDAYYDDDDLQSAGAGEGVTDLNETFNYKCFVPDTVYIESVNTYATVYSAYTTEPNVSTNANQTTTELSFDVSTPEYDQQSNAFSTELEFYVPETVNSGNPAYDINGGLVEDPRVSILVHGTYYETDGTTMDDCWYRFDLIPQEGSTDELQYVLRNNHYHFTLRNVSKRGSTEKEFALALTMPDNYRNDNDVDAILTVIEDDDIVSVTMDYYNTVSENGEQTDYQYYYIGVSSIYSEMPQTQDAVAGLKVVTNIAGGYMEDDGWTIDISALPTDDGDCAFSFIYDAAAEKPWIWLDHPEAVEVGTTYYYYIVAGNMRKKMRITITEGEYED
ncbi:MAG: hypothetical protein LUC86_00655 [Prevotellaceae bacterium]|nr:hypothetical protein [Prevotellaceae bacterium]